MPRKPELGRALTVAERQKRFREAQMDKKRTLESQIRAAQIRLGHYSTAELGEQISTMSARWNPTHQSVRDRVLLLARRLDII